VSNQIKDALVERKPISKCTPKSEHDERQRNHRKPHIAVKVEGMQARQSALKQLNEVLPARSASTQFGTAIFAQSKSARPNEAMAVYA
jgi:hypothetical protein